MARYKKIDIKIWNDAKFLQLSKEAKLIFLFLLTAPQLTLLGAVPMDKYTVSKKIGIPYPIPYQEQYEKPFQELIQYGILEYDEIGLFWIKNFFKYNPPENPKVVISWRTNLDSLPECPLLIKVAKSAVNVCASRGETFVNALCEELKTLANEEINDLEENGMRYRIGNGMRNGMPNKEQEQEQEQEYISTPKVEAKDEQSKEVKTFSESLFDSSSKKIQKVEKQESDRPQPKSVEKKQNSPKKNTPLSKPEDVLDESLWSEFLAQRKQKKAPVTERVLNHLRQEGEKIGWSLEQVINHVLITNWQGFQAEWVPENQRGPKVELQTGMPQQEHSIEYTPEAQKLLDQIIQENTRTVRIK